MGRIYKNSLTGKMVRRLVRGLLAGLFVMGLLYFGGKGCLQQFFFNTGYIYKREVQRADELQSYVDKNCLKAIDYKQLKNGRFRGIFVNLQFPEINGCCLTFHMMVFSLREAEKSLIFPGKYFTK